MTVPGHAQAPLPVAFLGGPKGRWKVERMSAAAGECLPSAAALDVVEGPSLPHVGASWTLRGVTSHVRYSTAGEIGELAAKQEGLRRPGATCAALIPIRKNAAWWSLAQDERRSIFEDRSHHIRIGLDYLPGVARRLHHCRDLGEPFDFLTWFEFAPEDADAFDEMVGRLRTTPEWRYVEREVDIRLVRVS